MDHKKRTLDGEKSAPVPVLYVAFELSNSTWKMACSDGSKLRHVTVTAGDLPKSKERLSEPSGMSVWATRCTR